MCGLAGFSGFFPADPNKMRVLLMENQERGSHSTGIYGKRLMRKPVPAKDFIKDCNFNHIASSKIVVAHTRYSTGTAKTKANAHPFVHLSYEEPSFPRANIIGTHNGWLINEHEVESKVEGFTRAEVDSNSIYTLMNMISSLTKTKKQKLLKSLGIEREEEVFMLFEGAMALAFIKDGRLFLYRRESRPLFVGKTREGYYYSSLEESLVRIGIPKEKIYSLKPNRLLVLNGSKIERIETMSPPRVALTAYQTSYNWDNGVDKKLVEELTGKKFYPVVTRETTNGSSHTDTTKTGITSKTTGSDSRQGGQIKRIITIEEAKKQPLALYGRTLLLPSDRDVLNPQKMLSTLIGESHLRRPQVESIKTIKGLTNNKVWINEMGGAISYPLFFNWLKETGTVKEQDSSMLRVDFRGYRRGQPEFFYSREDMYLAASVDHTDGAKTSITKVENSSAIIWLDKKLLTKNSEYYNVELTFFLSKVPGFIQRTFIKVPKGGHITVRAYCDTERIVDHCQMMLVHGENMDSFNKKANEVNFPIGKASQDIIAQSKPIYKEASSARDVSVDAVYISYGDTDVKKKDVSSGNPYSKVDAAINLEIERRREQNMQLQRDKGAIEEMIDDIHSSIKDVSNFITEEASTIQKKNQNWEHPVVGSFSQDMLNSSLLLSSLSEKLDLMKKLVKSYETKYEILPF